MTENNTELNNNTTTTTFHTGHYSDSKGTGVVSTLVFAIAVTVIMVVIAYFKGF